MGSERIWDPATESFQATPSGLNLFCSGHVLLPDGRLFVTGGHVLPYAGIRNTTLLNPLTGSWAAGPQMARGRWYPTATTLPDGRVLIVSGDGIPTTPGPYNAFYFPSDTVPEVYNPATNTLNQMPSAARRMPLYPLMFVAPDGRVVDAGPDTTTRLLNVQPVLDAGTSRNAARSRSCPAAQGPQVRTWGDRRLPEQRLDHQPRRRAGPQPDRPGLARGRAHEVAAHVPHAHRPAGRRRDGDGRHTVRARERRDDLGRLVPEVWHPATDTWTAMAVRACGRAGTQDVPAAPRRSAACSRTPLDGAQMQVLPPDLLARCLSEVGPAATSTRTRSSTCVVKADPSNGSAELLARSQLRPSRRRSATAGGHRRHRDARVGSRPFGYDVSGDANRAGGASYCRCSTPTTRLRRRCRAMFRRRGRLVV